MDATLDGTKIRTEARSQSSKQNMEELRGFLTFGEELDKIEGILQVELTNMSLEQGQESKIEN